MAVDSTVHKKAHRQASRRSHEKHKQNHNQTVIDNIEELATKVRSFEELGTTLGHEGAKKPALIDRRLDEVGRTKQRFERQQDRPFTATDLGRKFFARSKILQNLAAYIEADAPKPPRSSASLSFLSISRHWPWSPLTP
jgi:hypothetical protein